MSKKAYKSVIEMCEDMSSPEFTLDLAKKIITELKTENCVKANLINELEDVIKAITECIKGNDTETLMAIYGMANKARKAEWQSKGKAEGGEHPENCGSNHNSRCSCGLDEVNERGEV